MATQNHTALVQAAEILRDLAYQASVDEEAGIVRSGTGGLKFTLTVTADELVQFSCGVEMGDQRISLEQVNDFNRSYRLSKLIIDEDQDVVLLSDYLVDFRAPDAQDQLKKVMVFWEGSVSLLKELLNALVDDED